MLDKNIEAYAPALNHRKRKSKAIASMKEVGYDL
jgi:hypothetical protein